ncbi:MAG: hypothetical protein JSR37_04700 [Verrucomicrobia bacterium]|nr:hypothetical protein [Verrucomicrobiota bacterium]
MRKIWMIFSLLILCTGLSASSKKLLVLIIASDNHPAFLELQKIWSSYMNRYPDEVTAYFIKGDPLLEKDFEQRGNTFYTKTVDNYKPGILKKTILSLQALDGQLDSYDYVLRTNLSSVYDFPKLLRFLDTLPKERCYAARPLLPSYEVPKEYANVPFGWGAGFIISPDVARLIVQKREQLYAKINDIPDDVLVGAVLHEQKIPIIAVPFVTFTTREEWESQKNSLPQEVFHFRAKSHYLTRTLEDSYEDELYIASQIARKFYPDIQLPDRYHSTYPLEIALETVYEYYAAYPSFANEYMPYVKSLAKECRSCCEIGEDDLIWTWAVAQGLQEGSTIVGIFKKRPPSQKLLLAKKLTAEHGIDFSLKDDVEPCDLLVTDGVPSEHSNKYIVLYGKTDRWPIARDFLVNHSGWKLKLNCEKFIVLERV